MEQQFKIRDYQTIQNQSAKHEREMKMYLDCPYKGFDAVIFSMWVRIYIVQYKVNIDDPGALETYNIETRSSLEQVRLLNMVMDDLFPMLGINVPQKRRPNTTGFNPDFIAFNKKLTKCLDQMVDISALLQSGDVSDLIQKDFENTTNFREGPQIPFATFFNAMHNMYFEQLMVDSQEDEDLERLLWEGIATETKKSPEPSNEELNKQAQKIPSKVQKVFDGIYDPKVIKVKDQGQLNLQLGIVLSKKFKYYDPEYEKKFKVYSSIPVIVEIKTPEMTIDLFDKHHQYYSLVKFQVNAPSTSCEMSAKIVVYDEEEKKVTEVIMFELDFY